MLFGCGGDPTQSLADHVYIGTVKNQSQRDPSKYFVDCRELKALFGFDVKMVEAERPSDVGIGDLIVFMLENAPGTTPVARGIQKVFYEAPAHGSVPCVITVPSLRTAPIVVPAPQSMARNMYQNQAIVIPPPRREVVAKIQNARREVVAEIQNAGDSEWSEPSRVYTGLVKTQSKRDASKYFIECAELFEKYGCDVKLLDIEKPPGVDVGDTIRFIPMEMETGAPLAVNVSRVPGMRQGSAGYSDARLSHIPTKPKLGWTSYNGMGARTASSPQQPLGPPPGRTASLPQQPAGPPPASVRLRNAGGEPPGKRPRVVAQTAVYSSDL